MYALNVLIVGGSGELISLIKKSKYLNKLFITTETDIKNVFNIKFNTFRELAKKCKSLQIDIVIVEDERFIFEGIADVLKNNFINCIAPTAYWAQLALSNRFAKILADKYSILTPKEILIPNDFPVIVKANGFLKPAYSLREIVEIKQKIYNYSPEIAKTVYLEEYIDAKKYTVKSLFDGKNLITFPHKKIKSNLLKGYTQSLQKMLVGEKAEFMGFINSDLIVVDDKIYNTGFSLGFSEPAILFEAEFNYDFLYLLNFVIYQKLNEFNI